MGVSIAASAMNNGHQVYWMSGGRSDETRVRAEKHGLIEVDALFKFCQTCKIILSVCPPSAAEEVAKSVVDEGFKGLYLDANAISPQRAIKIGQMMKANNIQFVDGGIIGGPAWTPKETWLYLSGQQAHEIASCFSKGPLETKIMGDEVGKASALKMCYAAYSKGTTALLAAMLATAESLGVREELYQQWDMNDKGFSEQVNQAAGLPDEFHRAATEIYRRMSNFKDSAETPSLQSVLKALLAQ